MKHALTLLAVALLATSQSALAQSTDARVDSLLRRLTLEEKIGEMTQIDIGAVTRGSGSSTSPNSSTPRNSRRSSSTGTSVHC